MIFGSGGFFFSSKCNTAALLGRCIHRSGGVEATPGVGEAVAPFLHLAVGWVVWTGNLS